jgi:hypothetical protein
MDSRALRGGLEIRKEPFEGERSVADVARQGLDPA